MQDTNDTTALRDITDDEEQTYFYPSFETFLETYTTDLLGKRTQCSPEIAQEVSQMRFEGLTVVDAAKAVGVTSRAINIWLNKGLQEIERLSLLKEQGLPVEIKLGEERYVYFYELYTRAVAIRKLNLLRGIRKKGKLQWQSDSWLLERQYPDEFGRKTKVEVSDWRSEVIQLIKDGMFTYNDILKETNAEEAEGLFKSAGVPIITARAIEEDSPEG